MSRTKIRAVVVPIVSAAILGLTVTGAEAAPPDNDNFNRAENLTPGGCDASTEGDNFEATGQPGEFHLSPAASEPIQSVWFKWRSPVTDTVVMDTIGSDYDTILAVYRGTRLPFARLTRIVADDDSGGSLNSLVSFEARRGVTYRVAVDGFAASQGNHLVNITC
jgi:hypothetical protein